MSKIKVFLLEARRELGKYIGTRWNTEEHEVLYGAIENALYWLSRGFKGSASGLPNHPKNAADVLDLLHEVGQRLRTRDTEKAKRAVIGLLFAEILIGAMLHQVES